MKKVKWTANRTGHEAIHCVNASFVVFGNITELHHQKKFTAVVEVQKMGNCNALCRVNGIFDTKLAAIRWANSVMRDWGQETSQSRALMIALQG